MRTHHLVTISFSSPSLSLIKNELKTFGLNPRDWDAVEVNEQDESQLILVHREDNDVRLSVRLQAAPRTSRLAIQNVEWLITGA